MSNYANIVNPPVFHLTEILRHCGKNPANFSATKKREKRHHFHITEMAFSHIGHLKQNRDPHLSQSFHLIRPISQLSLQHHTEIESLIMTRTPWDSRIDHFVALGSAKIEALYRLSCKKKKM